MGVCCSRKRKEAEIEAERALAESLRMESMKESLAEKNEELESERMAEMMQLLQNDRMAANLNRRDHFIENYTIG